jgi:hypothetical protein
MRYTLPSADLCTVRTLSRVRAEERKEIFKANSNLREDGFELDPSLQRTILSGTLQQQGVDAWTDCSNTI